MKIEEFLELSERRLPNSAEFVALADDLGIKVARDGQGRPVLVPPAGQRELAIAMAKLLKREPWRSEVLAAKGLCDDPKVRTPEMPFELVEGSQRVRKVMDEDVLWSGGPAADGEEELAACAARERSVVVLERWSGERWVKVQSAWGNR